MDNKPDCQTCGACCGNLPTQSEDFLGELSVDDVLRLAPKSREELVVRLHGGARYLRVIDDESGSRCLSLKGVIGEKVSCGIYSKRPDFCRAFEAGSDACHSTRILRGVEALTEGAQVVRKRILARS